jgi:hypothetical protein
MQTLESRARRTKACSVTRTGHMRTWQSRDQSLSSVYLTLPRGHHSHTLGLDLVHTHDRYGRSQVHPCGQISVIHRPSVWRIHTLSLSLSTCAPAPTHASSHWEGDEYIYIHIIISSSIWENISVLFSQVEMISSTCLDLVLLRRRETKTLAWRSVFLRPSFSPLYPRMQTTQAFLPQLDEFYFTTTEKKILENCRCIVPNFINDSFISNSPHPGFSKFWGGLPLHFSAGPSKLLKFVCSPWWLISCLL